MQRVIRSGEIIGQARPWSIIGPYNVSLLETLFPTIKAQRKVLLNLLVSLALVGVLVGLARARFYLPDNLVPITFQTFGVLLMGGVLGWRWGFFAILVYYFLGMAGVPVFQGGGNGWHYVSASATGGYLIGFIAATWLVGYLTQHGWHHSRVLWPMLLANLVIYVPGLLWLHFFDLGWPPEGELFKAGMYPFIPGDLVKLMLAALVVGLGWTIVDRHKRSGQ